MPAGAAALDAYVASMVSSLEVGHQARALARDIFHPHGPLAPVMPAFERITACLLPPPLRTGFGLHAGQLDRATLAIAATVSRALLPYLPRRLRLPPAPLLPPGLSLDHSRGGRLVRPSRSLPEASP
jgi:uncharacterized protein (DUF2236 family)